MNVGTDGRLMRQALLPDQRASSTGVPIPLGTPRFVVLPDRGADPPCGVVPPPFRRLTGWQVHSCASDVPDTAEGLRIPELSYQSDEAVTLRRRMFQTQADSAGSSSGEDLLVELTQRAALIRAGVEAYVDEHRIRVLHIRNIMSLPYNLAATLAFYQLIVERTDIFFLLQHHDLYWEGPNA